MTSNVIDITPRLPTTLQREIDRAFPLLYSWIHSLPSDVDPEALGFCLLKAGVQYLAATQSPDVARDAALMFAEGER